MFEQNIEFVPYDNDKFKSWVTFMITFEIPANETVNLQISQTSSIPESRYVRLFMDNFSVGCIDNTKSLNIHPEDIRELQVDLDTDVGETVMWSSMDDSIVTVNEKGEVTAVVNGKTYIVAKIYDSRNFVLRERVCVVNVS